jgi:hypothetical protein
MITDNFKLKVTLKNNRGVIRSNWEKLIDPVEIIAKTVNCMVYYREIVKERSGMALLGSK